MDTTKEPLPVEGYAAIFNTPDLNGDIVLPGAFSQSLEAKGARGIRMLYGHEADPVGVWDVVREDETGLFVRGRILRVTPRAQALAALVSQGAIDGLSIGFRTMQFELGPRNGRKLIGLDLWEVSIVTFPMHPKARLTFKPQTEAA